jgi:large subunit ribosomal protein L20
MPRARKGAARTQARRKLLREARGYYGTKSRLKQQAKVAIINGLSRAGCLLNRKMLSEIAIHDPATFDALVVTARKHCSVAHANAA